MATTLNVSPFCCFSVGQLYVPQCLGLRPESQISFDSNSKLLPSSRCPSYSWSCKLKDYMSESGPNPILSYGHLVKCSVDDVPDVILNAVPDAVKQEYISKNEHLQYFILLDGQHRNTALRELCITEEESKFPVTLRVNYTKESLHSSISAMLSTSQNVSCFVAHLLFPPG